MTQTALANERMRKKNVSGFINHFKGRLTHNALIIKIS